MTGYIEVLEVSGGFVWRFLVSDRAAPADRVCIGDGSADTRNEARRAAEAFALAWECGAAT